MGHTTFSTRKDILVFWLISSCRGESHIDHGVAEVFGLHLCNLKQKRTIFKVLAANIGRGLHLLFPDGVTFFCAEVACQNGQTTLTIQIFRRKS